MRNAGTWTILLVAAWAALGCSTLSEKWDRFLEGAAPDRGLPTVPASPLGPDEELPGPKVVVLSFPGLSAEIVEQGLRDGHLPGFRHLRTHGTYARLTAAAPERATADAVLLTANRATGGAPYLRSSIVPPDVGRSVPLASPAPTGPTVAEAVVQAGKRAVLLRAFTAVAPAGGKSLFGGAWPALGGGAAPYSFAFERRGGDGARIDGPRGVRVVVKVSTSDRTTDVFLIDAFGPPRLADGRPSSTRLQVRASKDRARAVVIGSDDRLDLEAGRWSRPLTLRFAIADDVDLLGRARIYLRPTGSGDLELYVEPADFEPSRPPSWQPLSSPPEFARQLLDEVGELPRFSEALPVGALDDGVLGVRAAAAVIEAAFEVERRMFERVLVGGDFDLLHQSFALADEAVRLAQGGADEPVAFFGLRVPRERLAVAAAARLDRLVRGALVAAESGRLGPDVSVLVVSGVGPDGFYAVGRRGAAPAAATLADVAAFPSALLGVPLPGGATGRVTAVGDPIEPLPTVDQRRTAREEAELPTEFELRRGR